MKSTIKYFGALLSAALVVAGISSCKNLDYPDRYQVAEGEPTIDFVRYADSDEMIEEAFMSDVVCLVGDNLRSIVELWFNDQQAILNTSYITDHTLLVSVPKTQAVEKTDMIYMYNSIGRKYSYPFKVLPPEPEVKAMDREWAEPGETVNITGDYFIDLISVTFKNADPILAENLTYTSSKITLTVPEGAMSGPVQVATASGTVNSVFHYKDQRGMLFDFDGLTGLGNHGWHNMTIASDEWSLSGNYLQLGNGSASLSGDGGDWDDSNFSFEYWPGNWEDPETFTAKDGLRLTDVVDFSDWTNLALKFEICIPDSNPWKGTPMQIVFAPVTAVSYGSTGVLDIYGNELGGCNNTYFHDEDLSIPRALYQPWKETGSFSTGGKWMTVSLPIADEFVWFWDGSTATGKLGADSFTSLLMMVAAGDGSGAESTPIIKIDNIRVVAAE